MHCYHDPPLVIDRFMDRNFFSTTRLLDGGMGQELLARGMLPKGTLWSAVALQDPDFHQLV